MARRALLAVGTLVLLCATWLVSVQFPGQYEPGAADSEQVAEATAEGEAEADTEDTPASSTSPILARGYGRDLQPVPPAALLPAVGQTLHVSPSGSDDNPGTSTAPFLTIEKASEEATPGTTVLVAPGTYVGSFNTESSGSWLSPIVYRSERKWEAKLVGVPDEDHTWRNEGDHVIIEGFVFSGSTEDGLIESGSYVQVVGNILHGFVGNCVTTYPDIHDVDFVANVTFGCGLSGKDHGIYLGYSGGRVFNNISHGNRGYGIHCWHNCNRMVISNNLLFNNEGGGMVIGQGDSPNEGRVEADNFLVSNNIVMHNMDVGIEEHGATGSRNRFVNNTVFENAGNDFELQTGSQSGTLFDDPQMVDYRRDGLGDYRLLPASSSVNSGTPLGAAPVDIRGVPRPHDAYDRGVFEQRYALP